jgi:hypothetical protein
MSYMSSGWATATGPDDDGTVVDAFVRLSVCDPAEHDGEELALLARRSLRVRSWLDSLDARIAAQAAKLAAAGTSADAVTVLAGGGRRSRRDAQAAAERGDVCERMPTFADALADGTVTAGHVDAVAAAARSLDDIGKARLAEHADTLVSAAARLSPEQLEAEARHLARNVTGDDGVSRQERLRRERNLRRWNDRHTGMCHTKLSLDPLADAQVWTSINAALAAARVAEQSADDRTWDQLQADVVVDLITGARSGGGRAVPEVSVLIDYQTLLDGLHDAAVCETSEGQALPPDTVRRLCCDAEVIPVVFGDDGVLLDLGRSCRTANREQRRALRAMYRTCAHPQCNVAFDSCRIHHVVFWFHGGRSDLVNLVPLCEPHHHLVHEGGWALELFPDRRTVWRTPDGTLYYDGVTTDRRPRVVEGTDATPPQPNHCRRPRPTTAAEVAAELIETLGQLCSSHAAVRATVAGSEGRGPPG